MKILLSILFLVLSSFHAECNKTSDSLINVLKLEIRKKYIYDGEKEFKIRKYKIALARLTKDNLSAQYELYNQLYYEYENYKFDSAHVYTLKSLYVSNLMKDKFKQYESNIKLGSIQLSWGMFKEAFDCLDQLNVRLLPDSLKFLYYGLKTRALNDLANYNTNLFYSPANHLESSRVLDSVILTSKPDSYERYKYIALRYSISGKHQQAAKLLNQLIHNNTITDHQRAMIAYDLSNLSNDIEKFNLITLSAIYDIRSSTKQTLAILTLGSILFKQGNLEDAELFLNEAIAQSRFYGNRLRERESLTILSQVAAQKLINSENKKNKILIFLIAVVSVALIGIGFVSTIVHSRLKKVRIRESLVQEKYQYLDTINKKLLEDGHIKEEYIGYFFNVISGYILKIEKIKRNTERKLKTKDYDELLLLVKGIDIKQERTNLYYTFDKIFLKLFPNFITTFNSLLKMEDQIWPKDNEVLNTNLRIFALMRLGIKDSQTIANILETSISTIYTYKNRIKSKAIVEGDDFEKKIMDIKFVVLKTEHSLIKPK